MVTRKKATEENNISTPKKKSSKKSNEWPKVTIGSHSTRTEYEDGRVDFIWDWEKLQQDVKQAIEEYEQKQKNQ